MKKALILLVVLSVFTAGAFAQTLGGYTWVQESVFDGTDAPSYDGFYSQLVYSAEGENISFNTKLVLGDDADTASVYFSILEVQAMFLDGMVKMTAGLVDETGYRMRFDGVNGYTELNNGDIGGSGLFVELMPIDGLSVGYMIEADYMGEAVVKYVVEDLATVAASFDVATNDFGVAANLSVVDGLALELGFLYTGDSQIGVDASYGMDDITIDEEALVTLATAMSWSSSTKVSMAMAPVTYSAQFDIDDSMAMTVTPKASYGFDAGAVTVSVPVAIDGGVSFSVPVEFEFWF